MRPSLIPRKIAQVMPPPHDVCEPVSREGLAQARARAARARSRPGWHSGVTRLEIALCGALVRPIEGGCQQGLKYRGAAKILVAEALGSYFSASENIKARTAAAAETAAQMAETFLAVRASFASAAARRTL